MLKIKEQLHYRRGYTHASCSECDHYVEKFKLTGIGGADLGEEPRCRVLGLKPGRMFRVHPRSICDKYDNTRRLAFIKGETR